MDPRYPVGTFTHDPNVTPEKRQAWITELAALPGHLRAALALVPPGGYDRTYRDGGWTIRQIVHHVADSHLNAYTRMKLALTEDNPTIKTYDEAAWARLRDGQDADPLVSLQLLDALHQRWVILLSSLEAAHFARTAQHPEWGPISVDWLLQLYAWHSRHHVGHVKLAAAR
ncbi:MAG: YfiT family bacillithiol transferase [Acidobacteriota bacterium]